MVYVEISSAGNAGTGTMELLMLLDCSNGSMKLMSARTCSHSRSLRREHCVRCGILFGRDSRRVSRKVGLWLHRDKYNWRNLRRAVQAFFSFV